MMCSLRINVQRGQYCNDMRLMNSKRFFAVAFILNKKTNPVWNDTIIGHWVKLSTKCIHRNNPSILFLALYVLRALLVVPPILSLTGLYVTTSKLIYF